MIRAFNTVAYVGLLRPAPGTWGSLAALPLAWLLHMAGGFTLLFIASVALACGGLFTIARQIEGQDDHDPAEIVIDEVAGQWVALWPVSAGAMVMGADPLALWPGVLTAFIAFRAFDILKPGPVGWADRQPGAVGVMADDLIAGWLAALVVAVLAVFAHLVLM
jgi:phosphatidylglycerophosphatase A